MSNRCPNSYIWTTDNKNMASIKFEYRSTKNKGFLTLRFSFVFNQTKLSFRETLRLEVTKEYWEKHHNIERHRDIDIKNKQFDVKTELNKIENFILEKFNNTPIENINKEWLENQIDIYYNPPIEVENRDHELINYIDKYIENKKNEITYSSVQKAQVQKQMVIRYQKHINKTLLLTDVNTSFKTSFEKYCIEQHYNNNTIQRALRFIKSVCNNAKVNGLQTNFQLDNIKIKYEKVDNLYLNLEELAQIENIEPEKLTESLTNAKDWLIISCYTGQRVSDFMRFTTEMIRTEDGKQLIEFTQKKTNKIMTIPLMPKVTEILNKRNGQFPKPISDQKYNDYIKIICKIAGLTQLVKGGKTTETAENSKIYRKETGTFEKWELVTSHIGRRSFATNFYGKIPTTYLTYVTGHSTEVMFLNYIGKSNKDLALEMTKYF